MTHSTDREEQKSLTHYSVIENGRKEKNKSLPVLNSDDNVTRNGDAALFLPSPIYLRLDIEERFFRMALLTVASILSFIAGCTVFGLNTDQGTGIDVLKTLQSKRPSCDLHGFVKPTENSEDEYNALLADLTEHCSASQAIEHYRILCHMLLVELDIGCSLPKKSRPTPTLYQLSSTPIQICSKKKIAYTSGWIWKKLSDRQRSQLGVSSVQLCSVLTSTNKTLRLVAFFYKIAPRIRQADTLAQMAAPNKLSPESGDEALLPADGEVVVHMNATSNEQIAFVMIDLLFGFVDQIVDFSVARRNQLVRRWSKPIGHSKC